MLTKQEVSNYLGFYLIDKDISVKELAKKIGASESSIYSWMAGKVMNNRFYLKLLKEMEGYRPSKWVLMKDEEELNDYMYRKTEN